MDRTLVHNRVTLVYGRRFVNSTTSQTDTGTAPSVTSQGIVGPADDTGTESSAGSVTSSPTVVSAPSKVASLSISSSALVASMVQAASPAAPVANPIVSLPTSTYTGQALLTAACAIPLYTAVPLSDGSYLAAPVVGCAEQNPQCCPSVSQDSNAPAVPTASIIPFSEANPAIVSALNADPLILCPADYTSTARSCCPVGFSLYNQRIIGQTPCYSVLPQPLSVPPALSSQISSLSGAIAATATVSNPTVSVQVIINEIFALSLPLKNGIEAVTQPKGGLSLGAKIGIGVGGGLGAIIAITLIWLAFHIRKHHRNEHVGSTSNGSDVVARTGTSTAMSSTVTGPVSSRTWSPMQGYTSYTDEGHIQGPGGGRPWSPSSQQQQQQQQQYVRMPPPRAEFLPTQTAYGGQQTGGQMRYSELPGAGYVAPVEVDGREETGWYGQHQQPTYGQVGAGYSQSGGAAYTAYASPPDHVRPFL